MEVCIARYQELPFQIIRKISYFILVLGVWGVGLRKLTLAVIQQKDRSARHTIGHRMLVYQKSRQ